MNIFGALAPFYLMGLAALSLPILFHLIRRTPSGEKTFSSLMFLTPSPPTLSRRSRLDNILLLILRALALCLLAFAFTRPLFRSAPNLDLSGIRNRQIAIVVDTSASMQREGLWTAAIDEIEIILDDLEEGDRIALFTYHEQVETIVDFDQDLSSIDEQQATIRSALANLEPGWRPTDLTGCLAEIAETLIATSFGRTPEQTSASPLSQVHLVSDLQSGTDIETLQGYQWPEEVWIDIHPLRSQSHSNAGLRFLYGSAQQLNQFDESSRLRISNSDQSSQEQFSIHVVDTAGKLSSGSTHFVPAGENRVIPTNLINFSGEPASLRLVGDKTEFDNEFYLAQPMKQNFQVAFAGLGSLESPTSPAFFLDGALIENPRRTFETLSWDPQAEFPAEMLATNPLESEGLSWLAIGAPTSEQNLLAVRDYVSEGGRVLLLAQDSNMQQTIAGLLEVPIELTEAEPRGFSLLGSVDFSHPLFQPFADPRFSDFSGIRFWQHRALAFDSDEEALAEQDIVIPAKFDNDMPFLVERTLGAGKVYVLTSSWVPEQSQLALSTKFLPLIAGLVGDQSRNRLNLYFDVGDTVGLPAQIGDENIEVTCPDGETVMIGESDSEFLQTEMPGRYLVRNSGNNFAFAVNVAASESATTPTEADQLEALGVQLGEHPNRTEQIEWERQLQDRELEGRQKMWLWLVIGTILFLLAEMWIAGRIQVKRRQAMTQQAA